MAVAPLVSLIGATHTYFEVRGSSGGVVTHLEDSPSGGFGRWGAPHLPFFVPFSADGVPPKTNDPQVDWVVKNGLG